MIHNLETKVVNLCKFANLNSEFINEQEWNGPTKNKIHPRVKHEIHQQDVSAAENKNQPEWV